MVMQRDINQLATTDRGCSHWFKRLGLCGFLFFLIKGLLWLIVPGLLVFLGVDS